MRHETTNHQGVAPHNTAGPSHRTPKVALYARVSTRSQAHSLETQIQSLRDAAKSRGMEVVWEETEIVSGAASKLPKRDALLEQSRQLGFDTIMVTRLDRFGRFQLGMINAWSALEKVGVNFITLAEKIDYSTAIGKRVASWYAEIAETEKDIIKDRTREGREAAMLKGTKFGRPRVLNSDEEREITIALGRNEKQMDLAKQYNVSQGTIYRINIKRKHQLEQEAAKLLDGQQLQNEKGDPEECKSRFVEADAARVQFRSRQFLIRRYKELSNA